MRLHATPRQSMFTPFKIPRGPGRNTKLSQTRITEGVDERGVQFKIIDDWTVPSHAHRLLESAWIGTTGFREVVEYLSDSSDNESDGQTMKDQTVTLRDRDSLTQERVPLEECAELLTERLL